MDRDKERTARHKEAAAAQEVALGTSSLPRPRVPTSLFVICVQTIGPLLPERPHR